MLPAVASLRTAAHSIVVYTALTVVASLVCPARARRVVPGAATAAVAGVAFPVAGDGARP